MALPFADPFENDIDTRIREFVTLQRELLATELASDDLNATDQNDETPDNVSNGLRHAVSGSIRAGNANDIAQQSRTRALRNLALDQVSVGLYGRTVVRLTLNPCATNDNHRAMLLPPHRFTTGDEVQIVPKSSPNSFRDIGAAVSSASNSEGGVICQVDDTYISIALFGKNHAQTSATDDETTILGSPPFSIVPQSSVDVHNKMMQALAELQRHSSSHPLCGNVVHTIFSGHDAHLGTTEIQKKSNNARAPGTSPIVTPFNSDLDCSQLEAIDFALQHANVLSLIHGPPGTGKTSTVAELIQQAVHHHNYKVLVTAPSNVAVDNVLERIVQSQAKQRKQVQRSTNKIKKPSVAPAIRAVRIGHPARIQPIILKYSLEAQVQNADGTEIVENVRRELQSNLQILLRDTVVGGSSRKKKAPHSRGGVSAAGNPSAKRAAYQQVKLLRQEIRQRETKVVQTLLSSAQVILCTTVGAANKLLKDMEFDLVIIDEAAQALEASCWIPILKGKRLVLAGDHCQLPPTIKSQDNKVQLGLSLTLFERILGSFKGKTDQVSRMLKIQYRMHQDISNWASQAMYGGELRTHVSVARHQISDLETFDDREAPPPPLLLIDTAGCGMEEGVGGAGSRFNEGEAQLVVHHVQSLLDAGVPAEQIAVISPYNGQVELLRTLLLTDIAPKLEIRSVDGFQGGEREAVVLSLVRCNPGGVIGFLGDSRRLNVAITRAKRHCAVICDTETVMNNEFIGGLIRWIEHHGDYRSAMEFLSSSDDLQGDLEIAEVAVRNLTSMYIASNELSKPLPSNREHFAKKEEERVNTLIHQVREFAKTSSPGEELILSRDLSKNDRRRVHECATELAIDHRSEGLEGFDRQVILTIPRECSPVADAVLVSEFKDSQHCADSISNPQNKDIDLFLRPSSAFLPLGDSDVDDSDDNEETASDPQTIRSPPEVNSLLASLAFERHQRQQQRAKQNNNASLPIGPPSAANGNYSKITKETKGRKLGRLNSPTPSTLGARKQNGVELDDQDDMAFLDSQIEKVQNSHGRKVLGNWKSLPNDYKWNFS